jgi:putative hydrolase of the HAD superfamily
MPRALALPSPIRAVTFDVGGTLIKPWPSVGRVYADVASRHGIHIPAKILDRQFAAAWKAKKDFAHSRQDWSDLVDRTFAGLVEVAPGASFFGELYEEFTRAEAWRVFRDAVPCLQKLRERGIRLGAISNWDERLRPLLRTLELDSWFESVVVSIETGCPKPDSRIFALAASELKLDPAQILHVGDSFGEDVTGARDAGFQAVLLDRSGKSAKEERVRTLRSVPRLLDRGEK